ncbi:MAG: hypothetical protein JNG86_07555 [Verrucomicrobiaceae bacterium]|nr:hypothetical protein [Verrucomicrobiaceae bacterium]
MAKIEKAPTGEFHSGYGCVIITAAIGVFGFILWWGWYSLMTMDREIGAISQDNPVVLAQITLVPDLEKRLGEFAAAAKEGKPATLKLNAADLNALMLLTPDAEKGGYKDMLRVKSFDAGKSTFTTDCSLPMNTARFWEDKKRYLVGEIDFGVEMTAVGPDAKVAAVRVPGKTVPAEFIKGMQAYGYLGPYQTHETIGPVLKAVQQVKVEADGVWLSTEAEKK